MFNPEYRYKLLFLDRISDDILSIGLLDFILISLTLFYCVLTIFLEIIKYNNTIFIIFIYILHI